MRNPFKIYGLVFYLLTMQSIAHAQPQYAQGQASKEEGIASAFMENCVQTMPNLEKVRSMAKNQSWKSLSEDELSIFKNIEKSIISLDVVDDLKEHQEGWAPPNGNYNIGVTEDIFVTNGPLIGHKKAKLKKHIIACYLVTREGLQDRIIEVLSQKLKLESPLSKGISPWLISGYRWSHAGSNLLSGELEVFVNGMDILVFAPDTPRIPTDEYNPNRADLMSKCSQDKCSQVSFDERTQSWLPAKGIILGILTEPKQPILH